MRRTGGATYLPQNIDGQLCTHIIYAFANLDNSTLWIIPKDRQTDIDSHYYEQVTTFRQKGIKVSIALGGWNDSAGNKYSRLLANQTARRMFVSSVVEFIETNNFDGLDLDLEVEFLSILTSGEQKLFKIEYFPSIQHVGKVNVKPEVPMKKKHFPH